MVPKRKQHSSKRPVKQGRGARASRPNKIGASTPYHFRGKKLTPYGGLLRVATLLEKLGFQALLEQTITTQRITPPTSSCWPSCWASMSALRGSTNSASSPATPS